MKLDMAAMGRHLNVIGSNAVRLIAKVMQHGTPWKRADLLLVHRAVGTQFSSGDSHSPPTICSKTGFPGPARRLVTEILYGVVPLGNASQRGVVPEHESACAPSVNRGLFSATAGAERWRFWGRRSLACRRVTVDESKRLSAHLTSLAIRSGRESGWLSAATFAGLHRQNLPEMQAFA